MRICVIIPAYNEGQAIEALVSGIKAKGLPAVVIDDGSTDGTDAKAAAAGAVVLRSNNNLGKGEALKKGFAYSLDNGFDGAIVMDGDGQHRIEDVDKFLEAAKDPSVSLIVGNRMNDTRRMPALRAFTNRLMSRMVSKLSGQTVPDSQCGFRLLKRDLVESIRLESSRFEIESEMLVEAGRLRKKIVSVPIRTVYGGEESKINPLVDTVRFLWFLCRLAFRR